MISDTEFQKILKVNLATHLQPGEDVIWSSQTMSELKENAMQDIRVDLLKRLKAYIWVPFVAVIVWLLLPAYQSDVRIVLSMIGTIVVLEFGHGLFKLWRINRKKIGGYALTPSHLYELDEALKFRKKHDASNVKYALTGEDGIRLAPLGKTLNASHALRWLPAAITADHIQTAIDA